MTYMFDSIVFSLCVTPR